MASYNNFVIAGANVSMLNLMLQVFGSKIILMSLILVSFCCNSLDILPPKHIFTFRNLKKGVQEFHSIGKCFASVDTADVVVCKMYYINPFMPYGISHHYQLNESISNIRVVGKYVSNLFKF